MRSADARAKKTGGRFSLAMAMGVGLVAAMAGCEVVDAGDLVVTWRFNGKPVEESDDPCEVFDAARRPKPSGLARIDVTGPDTFSDFVVCDNRETIYPLTFYQDLAGRPPLVYARWLKDLEPGRYHVTLSFIDHRGKTVDSLGPVETDVTVARGKVHRIDLDVALPFGRVDVGWSVSGGDCTSLGAVSADVRLVPGTAADTVERVFDCDAGTSNATPFTPVDPGDYEVSARLLDGTGQALTDWKTAGAVTVTAGVTAAPVSVTFDASDLIQ